MSEAHSRLGRHAQLGGVVIELKHGCPADQVVGQVRRYLGWVAEEYARRGETAAGAIVARDADRKLRHAVRANQRLTLWTWDDELTFSGGGRAVMPQARRERAVRA